MRRDGCVCRIQSAHVGQTAPTRSTIARSCFALVDASSGGLSLTLQTQNGRLGSHINLLATSISLPWRAFLALPNAYNHPTSTAAPLSLAPSRCDKRR